MAGRPCLKDAFMSRMIIVYMNTYFFTSWSWLILLAARRRPFLSRRPLRPRRRPLRPLLPFLPFLPFRGTDSGGAPYRVGGSVTGAKVVVTGLIGRGLSGTG